MVGATVDASHADDAPETSAPVSAITCGSFSVQCGSSDAGAWAVNWKAADGRDEWCTSTNVPSEPCPSGTPCQFQGVSLYQASTCR